MKPENLPILSRKEHLPSILLEWTVDAEAALNKLDYPEGRPGGIRSSIPDDILKQLPELAGSVAIFDGNRAEESGVIRYIYSHME